MIQLVHVTGKCAASMWLEYTRKDPVTIVASTGLTSGRFRLVDLHHPILCDFAMDGDPSDGPDFVRDFHLMFVPDHLVTDNWIDFWRELSLTPWESYTNVIRGIFCDEKSG